MNIGQKAIVVGAFLVAVSVLSLSARAQKSSPSIAAAAPAGTPPIVVVGKPSPSLAGVQWADGSGPTEPIPGKRRS